MPLFGTAGRSIKLYLTGDSSGLDRTLAKSEVRLKRFERVAGKQSATLNSGLIGGFSKGGAVAAGAGLALLAVKNVTEAATNAQVILGQTSVAVQDAGLSWEKYGKQVQAASLSISKSSAFDDEQVLQSFQVFVRGQKDVAKSIKLSQLAADVARGRYTDLASATQLVNKAALGQIGALRRAGIAIDKNATSTQALAALQAAYGGGAVKYANSAAGAQDKLRVSVENLREGLGAGLLPVITKVAEKLSDATDAAGHLGAEFRKVNKQSGGFLGDALKDVAKFSYYFNPVTGPILGGINAINSAFGNTKTQLEDINELASSFASAVGGINFNPGNLPTLQNPNPAGGSSGGKTPSFGQPGFKTGKPNEVFRPGPTQSLRNQFFDNAIARRLDRVQDIGSLSGQIKALQGIKGTIQAQIAKTKDVTRRLNLGDEVAQIGRQIKGLNDEIAQNLKDSAAALKDARQKTADALRAQAEKLKQQASDIKSAVLDAFDTKSRKIDNARALEDAKKLFAQAQKLGDKGGLQIASRGLVDARRAVQRQRLEDTTFRVSAGRPGPSEALQIGSVTINVNSNQSPEQIAHQVLKVMQKRTRQGGSQTRGTIAGRNFNAGIY